jgi:hypothetical protein
VQPLARIRRNRQRPPSNGSIERGQSTSPELHSFVKTRLRQSTNANRGLKIWFCVQSPLVGGFHEEINLMFVSILLGVVLLGEANARQASGQLEIATGKLVNALRLLNTHEYSYKNENGRFADRDQMLSYLRQKGLLSRSPVDLANPKPYEPILGRREVGADRATRQPRFLLQRPRASCLAGRE